MGLKEGESVDVIVMQSEKKSGRSALDIIKEGPGQHPFKSAADVEEYLRAERELPL